jgi:DeoR/GlpR family transcriptional regulator of sugar metabolism
LCLAGAATAHVIQLGGEVRASGAVVGQQAIRLLEAMSFDRCFLGAEGFSVDFGISDKHMPEIELKRAAIQHARWTGLTIASNRWTKQSMLRIVNLRDVQCVITDGALDESARAVLAERGLDLVTAEGAP